MRPSFLVLAPEARELVAWNVFALACLAMAWQRASRATPESINRRAARHHEGRALVLALAVVAAVAVLVAVGSQLAAAKELQGLSRARHIALAAVTVISAWMFTQTLFAFEYAHDFYVNRASGRVDTLSFRGTADPLYGDFLYFACVIGTSGQTADVSSVGSKPRRVGLPHCVLAFFFNTTVLALVINIGAGLF